MCVCVTDRDLFSRVSGYSSLDVTSVGTSGPQPQALVQKHPVIP